MKILDIIALTYTRNNNNGKAYIWYGFVLERNEVTEVE